MPARVAIASLAATLFLSTDMVGQQMVGQQYADFLPAAPAQLQAAEGGAVATRAAVLVAADRYRNLPSDALPTARASAERLREALTLHAGFAPRAVESLDGERVHEREVRAAILAAGRKVQASDDGLLLLTWAGHGWVQGSDAPEQFLLSHYSAQQGDAFSDGISVGQLVSWLSEARAEAAQRGVLLKPVLLIDACRVARGAPPRRVVAIPRAAWQVFGTRQGQMVAAGQGGDPFLFTGTVLGQLKDFANRGGTASLDSVFTPCRESTLRQSNRVQDPELIAPADPTLARAGSPALVVPRRVSLTVRCVDALSNTAIAPVNLRFNDDDVPAPAGVGQRLLAPGRVVVAAHAEGYLRRTDEIDLAGVDAGGEVTLRLVPYVAVVRGRLTPAATATILAKGPGAARADLHSVEQHTARDGAFELRIPALAGTELQVVQQGRVLQRFALPKEPSAFLRDRQGRHDGVPLVELACELSEATLRELGADAPPVPAAGDAQLTDLVERTDWEHAKQAIASKRWDLARTQLRRIRGDPSRVRALLAQVEARWATGTLELALARGKQSGAWDGLDELRAWWASKPDVEDRARIAGLLAEVERESISLAVRRGFEAANKAYAEGELERALHEYAAVLPTANAHYRSLIEAQRADLVARLYRRHTSVAVQAELSGDLAAALDAYGKALEHSDRVRDELARLLTNPELAASPRGRELATRLGIPTAAKNSGPVPRPSVGWAHEVLDPTPGSHGRHPRRVRDTRTGIVFLLVEPGDFTMGSNNGDRDERPPHPVRITKSFYLAETETTQAQWQALMETNPSRFQGLRRPVENVSWEAVQGFLRRLDGDNDSVFRLPTEAEWEFACRAGTTTEFAFGDEPPAKQAVHDGTETMDVGSFAANAWGFLDMHGNVLEWCQDKYDAVYYASAAARQPDPTGPTGAGLRVVRGGSWRNSATALRSANRSAFAPGGGDASLGFRVARTLDSPRK